MKSLFLFITLFSSFSLATDLNIVDVRRNIQMSDNDPIYKDFYINGGTDSGLKKNQIITVVRKISVRDSSGTQTLGDMMIPVGQLKVIAVFAKIVVAREHKLFSRDDLPMLEQYGLMVGDLVDLKSPLAHVEPKKSEPKPEKSADSEATGPI